MTPLATVPLFHKMVLSSADFSACLKLHPGDVDVLLDRGRLLLQMGLPEQAVEGESTLLPCAFCTQWKQLCVCVCVFVYIYIYVCVWMCLCVFVCARACVFEVLHRRVTPTLINQR